MVKFAAAGYVCVDYYPDFNNRYYITGNGVDVLFYRVKFLSVE